MGQRKTYARNVATAVQLIVSLLPVGSLVALRTAPPGGLEFRHNSTYALNEELRAIAPALGVPCIDLANVTAQVPRQDLLRDNTHPNDVMGAAIGRLLVRIARLATTSLL